MQDNLYNLIFERTILASVLYSPELMEDISIKQDDFYLPAHSQIFAAMNILVRDNKPVDDEFIKIELEKQKIFIEQVMLDILVVNPVANIKAYESEVIDKSRLRRHISLTTRIKQIVVEEMGTNDDVVAVIESHLQDLDSESNIELPMDMDAAIDEFNHMTLPPLVKTGISAIDNMLYGGIEAAQLIHVGGDSNVGKTILTKQILKNVAKEHKVLFFSYEMPKWKISRQLANQQFNRKNYFITDTKMMKGTDIIDTARMIKRMHRLHNIRFVVIDSKMKITNNHYKGYSSAEKIAEVDAVLASLCQELDLVILIITQLSKEDQRNGTMSGYGSGMSDYEADMKLLISFMDSESDTRRKLEVKKNRQDVKHEPVTLHLDTKTLEFNGYSVEETIYDDNSFPKPFGGSKVNVTVKQPVEEPQPLSEESSNIRIEGQEYL